MTGKCMGEGGLDGIGEREGVSGKAGRNVTFEETLT